ncbi:MAG: helicase-exonuclease AddAB subunit AddA [Oscillospiraceae bacterium]|nr:helicase-exonuclease AddAB subunit AddA [Oscillospiraceae bacterium]
MAEVRLTAAQRAAVEDRGGALLVSAAAGSGKTKVLVDRLLSMVLSETNPHQIDEFLMITYTKAAASELRGKIQAAMQERLAQEPGNRYLQRQLTRIYLAEISTVHSFCANLLRENAYLLDIPADFRVGEELETRALRERVVEQAVGERYEAAEPEFLAFADTLGGGRDDRALAEIVLGLYDKSQSHRDPAGWLHGSAEKLDLPEGADFGETVWGETLLRQLALTLDDCIGVMERALLEMADDETLEAAYGPTFRDNLDALRALRACESWDAAAALGMPEFGRLKAVRKCGDPDRKELVAEARRDCMEKIKRQMRIFRLTSQEAAEEIRQIAPGIRGALRLTELFGAHYRKEKRRRHMLDFSDLEHEALRLLYGGGARPTAMAREISQRYAEIMVDEYQDSNEVQDAIFRAVSREERNLFLVGDVKQSIYRFRLADPGIFLQKYRTFRPCEEAETGEPRKIALSENFRSRPEILSAVNDVFSLSMSGRTGDLDYGEAEALQAGLAFPSPAEPPVELHCVSLDFDGGGEERNPKKDEVEAAFVAARIAALLREGVPVAEQGSTRPIRPGDIAILLRSPRSASPAYLAALQGAGIPCFCDTGEDILKSTELQVVSSLLETVENPHQDIPLLAVLASPLCGFTADDLAEIRGKTREGDSYDALRAASTEKSTAFLAMLDRLRTVQEQDGLCALYDALLRETDAEAIFRAMPGGAARAANLRQFRAVVMNCGQGGGDLVSFVRQLRDLRETGLAAAETQSQDAVLLTSIHKSKGLEYPVVVLAGLSKAFNLDDLRRPVLTHPALGVASNVTDLRRKVRYPSAAKQALARRLRDEAVSEELRILYVAMTRARERLIMTYCADYLESKLRRLRRMLELATPGQLAASVSCMGDWVLAAALIRTEAGELHAVCGAPAQTAASKDPWRILLHSGSAVLREPVSVWDGAERRAEPDLPDSEALRLALQYRYPHEAAGRLPSKLTATQLKGRRLDEEISDQAQPPARRSSRPAFLERSLTPAEAGTALHLAMQFLRYAQCETRDGLLAELRRLREEEFLTEAQAAAVDQEAILAFFHVSLGQRILHAEEVRREFKFSVLVDAGLVSPDAAGEKILLQGVTDCCLLEEDGVTVIDFKTDRVSPGSEAARAEHYRGQLEGYSAALSRIFARPVREKILYFFQTGTAISL